MTTSDLPSTAKQSWHRFLETYEPLRPELYRYCRYLTRSPWDAEDLAQDALARAFVTLARMTQEPAKSRVWLFRVASNLWIDEIRRRREVPAAAPQPEVGAATEPRASREAAGTLLVKLSPQERAAVVLKDVFELSLDETAEALGTTVGSIKTALHRGRGKLADDASGRESSPTCPAARRGCIAAGGCCSIGTSTKTARQCARSPRSSWRAIASRGSRITSTRPVSSSISAASSPFPCASTGTAGGSQQQLFRPSRIGQVLQNDLRSVGGEIVHRPAPRRDAAGRQPGLVGGEDVARRVSDHQRVACSELASAPPGDADDVGPRLGVASITTEAEVLPHSRAAELEPRAGLEVAGAETEQYV